MKNSESDVFLRFFFLKNCTFLNFGATIELKSNSRSQNISGHLILSIQRLMKAYKVFYFFIFSIYLFWLYAIMYLDLSIIDYKAESKGPS